MKHLITLFQIFLFFQIVLNTELLSNEKQNLTPPVGRDRMGNGAYLVSSNYLYYFIMQTDGNLVLYSNGALNTKGRDVPLWASNTPGKGTGPYSLRVQMDGNIIAADVNNNLVWSSGTYNKGFGPYVLNMQDDGNVVLTDSRNSIIFQTNTSGKLF